MSHPRPTARRMFLFSDSHVSNVISAVLEDCSDQSSRVNAIYTSTFPRTVIKRSFCLIPLTLVRGGERDFGGESFRMAYEEGSGRLKGWLSSLLDETRLTRR
jgi:hypothetical protein